MAAAPFANIDMNRDGLDGLTVVRRKFPPLAEVIGPGGCPRTSKVVSPGTGFDQILASRSRITLSGCHPAAYRPLGY